jgi:DNA-binding FadR family transcriptional regulator
MAGPSQVERTLQEIKQRIVEGQYRPGAHLSEAMLARIHRSSRTPVREALSRLLQEGYVEFEPHRGYAAARITLAAVRHMFEVRRLLEADAAARAAAVVTAADVERLRALADSDYSPGTRAAYLARWRATAVPPRRGRELRQSLSRGSRAAVPDQDGPRAVTRNRLRPVP